MRHLVHTKTPLVLYGSYNERIYLAEQAAAGAGGPGLKSSFIPASFPLPIIRRHTGTPFMGYAGATYVIQEFCNALFDALFHILPLGTELDKIDATPSRVNADKPLSWTPEAHALLEELIEAEPVLVRISAAKQMRDRAERDARQMGNTVVEFARLAELFGHTKAEAAA